VGSLTDWSFENPDAVLQAVGVVGGTIFGAAHGGFVGACAGALFGYVMSVGIASLGGQMPPQH
jgi:hypothetical protein